MLLFTIIYLLVFQSVHCRSIILGRYTLCKFVYKCVHVYVSVKTMLNGGYWLYVYFEFINTICITYLKWSHLFMFAVRYLIITFCNLVSNQLFLLPE